MGGAVFLFHRHCRLRGAVWLPASLAQKTRCEAGTADAADCSDLRDYRAAGADGGPASNCPLLALLRLSHALVVDALGALFLPLFTLFLGLWFAVRQSGLLRNKSDSVTKWLALASALTATGLLLYTGREVSVVQARPVWFSYAFVLAMFFSALQTFFALLIVAVRNDFQCQRQLAIWQLSALMLLAVVVAIWVSGDTLSGSAIRQWLVISPSARHYAIGWLACWLISLIFCALALRYPLTLPVRALLAVSAMALSWLMRWTLLIQGQTIPKFNAQFNPYTLPVGTDGWLAILGTFGLWIALLIIVRETVNGLARRRQHG